MTYLCKKWKNFFREPRKIWFYLKFYIIKMRFFSRHVKGSSVMTVESIFATVGLWEVSAKPASPECFSRPER